jgi:RNA-directed DNA polymerase
MNGKRQKTRDQQQQLLLAFATEGRDEVPDGPAEGTVPTLADSSIESPTSSDRLMDRICDPLNFEIAMARVIANDGSPGVDGMTVKKLEEHFEHYGPRIIEELLSGNYRPQPVKRVEIPKPDGGVRKLGIPTAVDRVVQQAILLVLSPEWDETFSDNSFGFRPYRSAQDAVARAQSYLEEGYKWVVDMDLEKFFDRVNHDVLMSRVARRVKDKRLLRLIRAFLNAGVMENGLFSGTREGTPQGGPLSPLLSNLLLDELDQELTTRGLRFSRYADDCNIYVKSRRAGERVLSSVTKWLDKKLRLTVNQSKSAVDRPWNRKFLGFTFTVQRKIAIAPQSKTKFKKRVRELTKRNRGSSLQRVISELRSYLLGWRGYFGFCQTRSVLRDLDSWVHRRLRCYAWKQWKTGRRRFKELRQLGVGKDLAAQTAGSRKGYWHTSRSPALNFALPGRVLAELGVPLLLEQPESKV